MKDFPSKTYAVICIAIIAGLQLGAWYIGVDGQMTTIFTAAIVGLVSFITGLKIDISKK